MKAGDLVVPAVDLGTEPNVTILTEGRPPQERSEGVVAQSQDVQDSRAAAALPAAGQGPPVVH